MTLSTKNIKVPCKQCILLPICLSKVRKQQENAYPYYKYSKSFKFTLANLLSHKCSILRHFIYDITYYEEGNWSKQHVARNDNNVQALYEFFNQDNFYE